MKAVLMHGARGGEGTYRFDLPRDLVHASPVRIMRAFMEHAETRAALGHIDYEINAALKNREHDITTVIGEFVFGPDNRQPFCCFIAPDG
jgi:hypothetical protein